MTLGLFRLLCIQRVFVVQPYMRNLGVWVHPCGRIYGHRGGAKNAAHRSATVLPAGFVRCQSLNQGLKCCQRNACKVTVVSKGNAVIGISQIPRLELCFRKKVFYIIEQPQSSLLFQYKPLKDPCIFLDILLVEPCSQDFGNPLINRNFGWSIYRFPWK